MKSNEVKAVIRSFCFTEEETEVQRGENIYLHQVTQPVSDRAGIQSQAALTELLPVLQIYNVAARRSSPANTLPTIPLPMWFRGTKCTPSSRNGHKTQD